MRSDHSKGRQSKSVLIVEKYTTGYAGRANRGAGIMDAMAGVDPERYVEYHTRNNGDYLNDQVALYKYAAGLDEGVACLDRWTNGKICKDKHGNFRYMKWRALPIGKDPDDGNRSDECPAASHTDF